MSSLTIELPDSLSSAAHELARRERITFDQLVASALAEKVSALGGVDYLAGRAARGDLARFQAALAQVPDVEPAPEDRLDAKP